MDGYQQLGQPAVRSAAAQEPWDELVHARGRPQIDEPGQDVDEICLRIDGGQLAGLDEVKDVSVDLDPRCGHHQRSGQAWWLAEPRAPLLARALATAGSRRIKVRRAVASLRGCKIYDSKEKAGTHLDDHPIGVP